MALKALNRLHYGHLASCKKYILLGFFFPSIHKVGFVRNSWCLLLTSDWPLLVLAGGGTGYHAVTCNVESEAKIPAAHFSKKTGQQRDFSYFVCHLVSQICQKTYQSAEKVNFSLSFNRAQLLVC